MMFFCDQEESSPLQLMLYEPVSQVYDLLHQTFRNQYGQIPFVALVLIQKFDH